MSSRPSGPRRSRRRFSGRWGSVGRMKRCTSNRLLAGMRTPKPRAANDPARELARAEKVKHAQPLLQASGRVAVKAAPGRAGALLSRTCGTLRLLDAPGVAVVRRSVPARLGVRRLLTRGWPLTRWPASIHTHEAAGLVGVPPR